jgi:hypothetical protein
MAEMKIITILAFISLVCISCELDSDNPSGPPVLIPPIVNGIIKTHESGQVFGVIGKPCENRKGINLSINGIFPNPNTSVFQISFDHYIDGLVQVWLSPANVSGDILSEIYGLNSFLITNSPNTVLVFSQVLSAGEFTYNIDLNKFFNYPYGYYRLYLQTEDELLWADLLCY